MKNSRSHILIIYPYSNIDANPTMTFLLESLAERRVQVDVLLDNGGGLPSPEPIGDGIYLESMPSNFFSEWTSLRGLPKRIALKLLRPRRYSDYSLSVDPVVFGLFRARRYAVIVGVDPQGIS